MNSIAYLDRGSSNLPTDCIWNIRSPPPRYSMTKNRWSCQSINQSINQPTSPSICQSISQSVSQTANQLISRSINPSINQPVNQLLVCKWRHGGNVGGQEQKHFSPLGTKLYFDVNSWKKILLFWPSTWPPWHVVANQELITKRWRIYLLVYVL